LRSRRAALGLPVQQQLVRVAGRDALPL